MEAGRKRKERRQRRRKEEGVGPREGGSEWQGVREGGRKAGWKELRGRDDVEWREHDSGGSDARRGGVLQSVLFLRAVQTLWLPL